jgi:hypothetical protein
LEDAPAAGADVAVDIGQQFVDTPADGPYVQIECPVPQVGGDDAADLRYALLGGVQFQLVVTVEWNCHV